MARPRKYATAAEAAHARKLQERDRKRRSRAPEHAKKAVAIAKWKREQAIIALHEKGERLLVRRARQAAKRAA